MITVYYKVAGKKGLIKTDPTNVPHDAELVWYDFEEPSEEDKAFLKDTFRMRNYTYEDLTNAVTRPKLKLTEHYQFMTFYLMDPVTYDMESVNILMKDKLVITYHKLPVDELEGVVAELEDWDIIPSRRLGLLILDRIVDQYFEYIHEIEDRVIAFEKHHANLKRSKQMMNEIFILRSKLVKLKSVIMPMNELLMNLEEAPLFQDDDDDMYYIRHIDGHLDKQEMIIKAAQEMTIEIRDNYDSYTSYHMNRVMQILTLFSTIFLPLTLITGIYGMNFEFMPELKWHYGYFMALGLMLLISLSSLIYFRTKHWY